MKKTINTSITATWGVMWDERETVRDFYQNFYDANEVADIHLKVKGNEVTISAPTEFDYRELLNFTSSKRGDDTKIGNYGEGFKASLVNALREWNCKVSMIIKDKRLDFYFDDIEFAEREDKVMKCDISDYKPIMGTQLVVSNCPSQLIREFEFGLKHFYYEDNPLFGDALVGRHGDERIIFKSTTANKGYVFYNKLLRAEIELPLVIVCNKTYKNVENKIAKDRDRTAFNADVLSSLLKLFFRGIRDYQLKSTILELKDWWVKGHNILGLLANSRGHRYGASKCFDFPKEYYAKNPSWMSGDTANLISEMDIVEKELKEKGHFRCNSYMYYLGMDTLLKIAEKRVEERNKRLGEMYSRSPSATEQRAIEVLADFIKKLSPTLYRKFIKAKYTIGENDEVLGELKPKYRHKEEHVFLNKSFFTFHFHDALAVLFHEWAHIFGSDGSRTFSDALTVFIALILKNENILKDVKDYQKKWEAITSQIEVSGTTEGKETIIQRALEKLEVNEMQQVLEGIPSDELYKLLKKNDLL